MNADFIKRATAVTSFNLVTKDFESTTYKAEIQHIFQMFFFPGFNLSNTTKNVDIQKLNANIQKLKAEDFEKFKKMHAYNLKGVGPGEVTLYFLVNDAHLGGGSSAGVDLVVGPKKYEVKAVDVSSAGFAFNFKLGGTFDLSDVVAGLLELKKKVGVGGEGVNKAALDTIRKKYPKELKLLEEKFVDRAYENYFKNHEIIFIQNSTRKIGEIAAIKSVKKEDILERLTSGVIKPMVKL
jgi:hypothetical protein